MSHYFKILNQSPKGKGKDQKFYNGSWDMDFFLPKGSNKSAKVLLERFREIVRY